MKLRPATMDDASLLLAWRNDPLTRAHSIQTAEVSLLSHLAWLERSLVNPLRRIHIAMLDGVPVGTVREDDIDGGVELSWTVAPEHRGLKHGTRMVALAATAIRAPLVAHVKADNSASQKIARAIGMTYVSETDGLLKFMRQGL